MKHPIQLNPGRKFGKLTVIEFAGKDSGNNRLFKCICDCGGFAIPRGTRLLSGETLSCKQCGKIQHGESSTMGATKEYRTWAHVKERCSNPTCKGFNNYGGKGIKVCDRWMNSFANFLEDVGRAPSKQHTLDRYPDNKGNYEPGNVRWANWFEQQGNRTNNRWVEHEGERYIVNEWARRLNMDQSVLSYHLNRGRTIRYIIDFKNIPYVAAS